MIRFALAATTALTLSVPAFAQQVPAIGGGSPPPGMMTAAAPANTQVAQAAQVPTTMPPPLPTMAPQAPLAAREQAALRQVNRWRLRSCGTSMGPSGVLQFQHGNCEPTLVCAPFKLCGVALEPGEGPTDQPDIGDPRWKTNVRYGVDGGKKVMHIVFKPDDAGLDSNFMLQTNRRTITLRLVSRQRDYMPLVKLADPSFANQQSWRRAIAANVAGGAAQGSMGGAACDQPPVIPPAAFEIDSPRALKELKPTQVYTVAGRSGPRTCIEFLADIGSKDLLTLVVLDGTGGPQLATAHFVGRRMEVDTIINAADLVMGVGSDQSAIKIRRREFR